MGCSNSTPASPPSAPPKCTLLTRTAADHAGGAEKATYRVDGFVACSKFLKGFNLKEGDEVIVYPDLATLKQSCDEGTVGWDDDKEKYIASLRPQEVGIVGKCDIVGEGRRVYWPDRRWWSFAPDALAVRLTSLDANQRQFLIDGSEDWVIWNTKSRAALQAAAVGVPAVVPGVPAVVLDIVETLVEPEDPEEPEEPEDPEEPGEPEELEEPTDDGDDDDDDDDDEGSAMKVGKLAYGVWKMAF